MIKERKQTNKRDQFQTIYESGDNKSVSSKDCTQRRPAITAVCGSRNQVENFENTEKLRKWRKENETLNAQELRLKVTRSAKQESGKREAKIPTNIALHKLAKQGYSK